MSKYRDIINTHKKIQDLLKKHVLPVPEVGKVYNCYDDGKISEGRLYTVKVSEVIPFDKIDAETLELWLKVVEEHNWLYSTLTDYIVKIVDGENGEDGIFVRTCDGGWFGLGEWMNSGRLDIDGSLTKILKSRKNDR